MSVVKRSNSQYWYIQFQLRGKTYIKSSRTLNKKAAEQMEVEWKAKIHGEQFLGHRQDISVREAIEEFCASKQGTPHHRTLMYYCRPVLKALPSQKPISELTSHDLERFKRDKLRAKVSPQTLKHYINLIRGAWKLARKLGYRVSPLEFPMVKLPKSSLRYLSADEEARLLACLDPRRVEKHMPAFEDRSLEQQRNMQDAYDLVVLLLDTGARYSEIANIEWSRVDLAANTIHLWRPKVQNEGILYMTDRVHAVLTRRAQECPEAVYVFQNRSGGPRGYIVGPIRKAIKKARLEGCKIHTLRHTHASRLIQNGLSVYEVREVLGHTDIKTTMRYAHLESRQVTSKARDVINMLNSANRE